MLSIKPSSTSGRILVVDDDDGIRALLRAVISGAGHEVDVASDGAQALDVLARIPYDAVILDLMMPGINGFEVIKHLEKENPLKRYVIVLSAATPKTIEDLQSPAICSKLRKPFDIQELFAAIDGCIASRG